MATDQQITDEDLARLADLHASGIEDSLPALLGASYLKHFYSYVCRSKQELLLLEREKGQVESACLLSFDPAGLQNRIVWGTWIRFFPAVAKALVLKREIRVRLLAMVRAPGDSTPVRSPEITYIVTSAQRRGRGLGSRLVARVDVMLRERGVFHYYARTIDALHNRALQFYLDNGFTRIDRIQEGGRFFAVFEKRL